MNIFNNTYKNDLNMTWVNITNLVASKRPHVVPNFHEQRYAIFL